MHYAVCVEQMENRWVAHAPALLGCYASSDQRSVVDVLAPAAIRDYFDWRHVHGDTLAPPDPIECTLDEVHHEWIDPGDPDNSINAFFAADAAPMTAADIKEARRVLDWSRADLLAAIQGLPTAAFAQPVEGEWSIGGILNHTARAELWYLDRLDLAFPREQLPTGWRERLDVVRTRLLEVLPQLQDAAYVHVKDNEIWSPRKLLRRSVWHERDHTQHIWQFRARLGV